MKKATLALLSLISSLSLVQAAPLNVVTYNIRLDFHGDKGERDWDARKDRVSKYLLDSKASIIGLQEALPNQMNYLTKSLNGMKYIGVGRDDGKHKGEFSAIFYNPEQWTADNEESGTFWLSATPEKPGSMTWGNGIPRICSYARFLDQDGKGIYVYNTHWDHRSQNSRLEAAKLILSRIEQRKHKEESVILMGDFNANTENKAIQILLASPLLKDVCKQQVITYNDWQGGLKPGLRIDHIFTSPSLKNITVKVHDNGDPPASDHHPMQLIQTP